MAEFSQIYRVCNITGVLLDQKGTSPEETVSKAIKTAVDWVSEKTEHAFLQGESDGSFPIELNRLGYKVEAFRIKPDADTSLWMLEFSHACRKDPSRTWIIEIAIAHKDNENTKFGVRLYYKNKNQETEPVMYSIPRVFRDFTKKFSVVIDGKVIADHPEILKADDEAQFQNFVKLFDDPKRKLPIVLATENVSERFGLRISNLGSSLLGIAHFYVMDEQTAAIIEQAGQDDERLVTYKGSVSLIMPESSVNHMSYDRRQALHISEGRTLAEYIKNETFRHNLARPLRAKEFPSFSEVKQAYLNLIRSQVQGARHAPDSKSAVAAGKTMPAGSSESDIITGLREDVACLQEKLRVAAQVEAGRKNQLEETFSLAAEEEGRGDQLALQNVELARLVEEMEGKLKLATPAVLSGEALFPSLDLVGEWADALFASRMIVTERAREAAKDSKYADPELVFRGLTLLAQEKWDIYTANGDDSRRMELLKNFEERRKGLTLEDRISLKESYAAKYGKEYYADHGKKTFFLDKHLTKGNTFAEERCLRIYYTFDDKSKKIVVGYLPRHLTNSMT